jgi:CBS domain-containing protein
MPILVKEIMSKPVVVIEENKTARKAGELMKKKRKGALVVVRKGKPVGIITDSDLIRKVVAKNLKPSQVKVKEIMSKPLVTITPDESIIEASRKMKRSNIKRLPVVDGGRVVGLVSITDIARTSPEMLDLLEYRLRMREEPFEIKETFTSGICDNCGNYSERLTEVNDKWLCEECKDELESEY